MTTRHITYLKRIHGFIKKDNVRFVLCTIPSTYDHGYCITNSSNNSIIIIIDPKKEFVPSIIHECIHGIYPEHKEAKVMSIEKNIMNNISQSQVLSLLKCFYTFGKFIKKTENIKDLL
jgi:hypothetical protein